MKILGRILIVLIDIILVPISLLVTSTVVFVCCVQSALKEKDIEWITKKFGAVLVYLAYISVKMHIDFLKTGNVKTLEELSL